MNQFYLTLPSNSSLDYYPNNKATNYITHLPRCIRLDGDGGGWEVALVEAHYPLSFMSVGKDTAWIELSKAQSFFNSDKKIASVKTTNKRFKLKAHDYKSVSELIAAINNHKVMKNNKATFQYNEETKLVKLVCADKIGEVNDDDDDDDDETSRVKREAAADASAEATAAATPSPSAAADPLLLGALRDVQTLLMIHRTVDPLHPTTLVQSTKKTDPAAEKLQVSTPIPPPPPITFVTGMKMSKTLTLQLGFDPLKDNGIIRNGNDASRPADIKHGVPSEMYVYCDLVEPQFVGDTVAPLLKIVNIENDGSWGSKKTIHFHDPHYVPIMKSAFETVEIDLRDSTGASLPFQFGDTYMKLHLRRARK